MCFIVLEIFIHAIELTGRHLKYDLLPGASTGDRTHDKVMRRGLMDKASRPQGFPLSFPEHLPPKKPESACPIVL